MNNEMKKILIFTILYALSCTASAQTISLTERADADIPYFLISYSCDFTKLVLNNEGRQVVGINEKSPLKELVVSPLQKRDIEFEASAAFAKAAYADEELRRIRSKVDQFENVGNIEAMNHWRNKHAAAATIIESAEKRKIYKKNIDQLVEIFRPVTYYQIYGDKNIKYSSVEEMRTVRGNDCSKQIL
jgi:hypothetical protein